MNAWKKALLAAGLVAVTLLGAGCGGSGDDAGGTVSIALTDAKPVLPAGVTAVELTIDEVEVHRSGSSWVSLPLATTPYTVDLLQFQNGQTTQFVPEVTLEPGQYTQLRLLVSAATLTVDGQPQAITVPSGKIRTDRTFEVPSGGAVALTVDFDLSQSIVAQGNGAFELKPVLHLVETTHAAEIHGAIADATFGDATEAEVVVTWDANEDGVFSTGDQEYTRLKIPQVQTATGRTEFRVYWVVPDQGYTVQVEVGGTTVYEEFVPFDKVPPGAAFALNGGDAI